MVLPNLPEFYQGTVYMNGVVFTWSNAEIYAVYQGYQSPPASVENGNYTNLLVQTIPLGSEVSFLLRLQSGQVFEALETDIYEAGKIHLNSNPIDLHFEGELDQDVPEVPEIPAVPEAPEAPEAHDEVMTVIVEVPLKIEIAIVSCGIG